MTSFSKCCLVEWVELSYFFCNLESGGLECYQCGIYYEEKPFLLGAADHGSTAYDYEDQEKVPACNFFNASMPIFRVTCKDEEKGCLKGWITQVVYHFDFSISKLLLELPLLHPACGSGNQQWSGSFLHENSRKCLPNSRGWWGMFVWV